MSERAGVSGLCGVVCMCVCVVDACLLAFSVARDLFSEQIESPDRSADLFYNSILFIMITSGSSCSKSSSTAVSRLAVLRLAKHQSQAVLGQGQRAAGRRMAGARGGEEQKL